MVLGKQEPPYQVFIPSKYNAADMAGLAREVWVVQAALVRWAFWWAEDGPVTGIKRHAGRRAVGEGGVLLLPSRQAMGLLTN